jgi:hypothetical protein
MLGSRKDGRAGGTGRSRRERQKMYYVYESLQTGDRNRPRSPIRVRFCQNRRSSIKSESPGRFDSARFSTILPESHFESCARIGVESPIVTVPNSNLWRNPIRLRLT